MSVSLFACMYVCIYAYIWTYVWAPGVLRICGDGLFIFRELGSTGYYFRELGSKLMVLGIKGALQKVKIAL